MIAVVLGARDVRKSVTESVPETHLTPLQVGAGFEVQLQIRIEILAADVSDEDDHQTLAAVLEQLVHCGFVFEAAPLGFDKVVRDDHDGAAAGFHGPCDGFRQVAASAGWAVAVLQAELVTGRSVLQIGGQHLLDEGVVFGRVTDEGVEEFGAIQRFGDAGRPHQTQPVTSVAPDADGVAVDEGHQDQTRDAHKGHQGGDQKRKVIVDDPLLDDGRCGWSGPDAVLFLFSQWQLVAVIGRWGRIRSQDADGITSGRPDVVGNADELGRVGHFASGHLERVAERSQEGAVAAPVVIRQRQLHQVGTGRNQIPDGEIHQPVAIQPQHLQIAEWPERGVAQRRDDVVVQVEFTQRFQVAELEAHQRPDVVVLQVQRAEAFEAVERPVPDHFDPAVVQEQLTQVLASDELVAG